MTGIFYGSTTGNTEALAKQIAARLGVAKTDLHDVGNSQAAQAAAYDLLLLGTSTWGLGELQSDWESFITELKKADLTGKKVALFGCGDSASYPDTFCDGMAILREELEGTGCIFVGETEAAQYSAPDSRAFEGGNAIGLAADDEPGKTDARLDSWLAAIKHA